MQWNGELANELKQRMGTYKKQVWVDFSKVPTLYDNLRNAGFNNLFENTEDDRILIKLTRVQLWYLIRFCLQSEDFDHLHFSNELLRPTGIILI